jgi:hypothetical protein
MEIKKEQNSIVTNVDDRLEFEIDPSASSFIIEMLSSRLYTDPLIAVVRELITNALDASPTGKPIRIDVEKRPQDLIMLSVQDDGVGMGTECVKSVLSKVGASTKNHDNKAHGGYGIGLLSVFAVSEQAQIDTVSDGVYFRYLLHRNERNVPSISLVEQWPAREGECGTRINVPIVAKDAYYFGEVKDAVLFFAGLIQPQPFLSIRVFHDEDECVVDKSAFYNAEWEEGNSYAIVDIRSFTTAPQKDRRVGLASPPLVAKIGEIPYVIGNSLTSLISSRLKPVLAALRQNSSCPMIDGQKPTVDEVDFMLSILSTGGSYGGVLPVTGQRLVLPIPIGQIDLPASREEVLGTESNITLIEAALFRAAKEIRSHYFQQCIQSDQATLSEKMLTARGFFFSNFEYQKVVYNTASFSEKIWVESIDTESKAKNFLTKQRLYIGDLIERNEKLILVVGLRDRGQLGAVTRLFERNNLPLTTRYATVKTLEEYHQWVGVYPATSLVFDPLLVLYDEMKTRPKKAQSPESIEAKKQKKLEMVVSSLKELDNIFHVPSVRNLGLLALKEGEKPEPRHKLFNQSKLPVAGKIVYHPMDRIFELDFLGILAEQLDFDFSCYLLEEEIAEQINLVRPGDLVGLTSLVSAPTRTWIENQSSSFVELGFIPFLFPQQYRIVREQSLFDLFYSASSYRKIISKLICDPGILRIADPRLLEIYQNFSEQILVWLILLQYEILGFYDLRETVRVLNREHEFSVDSGCHQTIRKLFQKALDLLPYMDFFLNNSMTINDSTDWTAFAKTTNSLALLVESLTDTPEI